MAYRADFFVWSAVTLSWIGFNIVFLELVFSNFTTLAGWTKGQVYVLQGFYFFIDLVIWGFLYNNLYEMPRKISRGELDLELTKPIDAQFLLSLKQFSMNHVNSFVMGVVMIYLGITMDHLHPSLIDFGYAIGVFLIAAFFVYSGYFASVCSAFWFDRLDNIMLIFPQIRQFSKIPYPAFTGWVRVLFCYIVPAALLAALPSEFLFGRRHFDLVLVLALFATLTFLFSRWIFARGLKHYSSASS
jgi:ABC-2 type transport system permease protein